MLKNKRIIICLIIILFLLNCVIAYSITYDNIFSKDEVIKAKDNSDNILKVILKKIRDFLGVIFTLYTVFIAIVIFMENNNPEKTISWLLVLFLVPVLGFILYLFLGQNIRKKNIFKKKENISAKTLEDTAEIQLQAVKEDEVFASDKDMIKRRMISLILNNSKAPVTINNKCKVLTNGKQKFQEVIEELNKAKDHIHLEYFIIKNDNIGNKIKDILIRKAKEGVIVRVIYDSVGSWRIGRKYINDLKEAGVQVAPFLKVFLPGLSRELNYRNHRKIIVIDGKIGFIGGINIGDEYLGRDKKLGFWRDTHLKIMGESVFELQIIFMNDWYFCTKEDLEDVRYFPKIEYYGEQLIQISPSGPDTKWDTIMQAYFSVIASANEKVWITTPYLVPDDSIKMALKTAALSGIDVRIIIPEKADHITAYWGSRANIEELLKAGVKIYSYTKGFIHSKVLVVDNLIASVGTANMDIRSFLINFEVNAFLYDEDIINRLEKDFIMDFNDSEEIVLEDYLKRPFTNKIMESVGRILSPLL
ncbi:cardiolipin synthase [Clostridiisalibacter paucivorans]|uniref:cardiolipin synthase n=1 Tax=Clostridiisalibacter paucivorans TaxID=408753 RepID=UPI00047B075D|nr:cardiolipin synthase [Clostridiisalibacter paucivorans]